ncbi:MAG: zinc-binding dehydrogenase [Oscillospiraceae bacterium]|jgi:threonine dehydrogenase-like Zn-dependent dehydrogenase|nr:zinc-binding dehydrogenase [Oscillospiraceae bacterium]
MKSRAMVLEKFGASLKASEIDIPVLEEGQVLVKIDIAGVCGSDVHIARGHDPRVPLPIILGHEGVGHVAAVKGERSYVQGGAVHEGDKIMWNRGYSCGRCASCLIHKEPSVCKDRKVYGINMSCETAPYLNGCYAEYMILSPLTDLFIVDGSIPSDVLVTTACSGATVAHGFDMVNTHIGQTVLIQGPGPLGAYAAMFAKSTGASEVIVTGGSQNRLEVCRKFGATMALNRRRTTEAERYEIVMERTRGNGVDLVVETAGSPGVVEEGIKLVRPGGTYLSIGFSQPAGIQRLDFYKDVVKKNVRIQGVWVSDCRHTFLAMELCRQHPEAFRNLVTHSFPLERANEALAAMAGREAMKAVLEM